jgi:hypothetical protein
MASVDEDLKPNQLSVITAQDSVPYQECGALGCFVHDKRLEVLRKCQPWSIGVTIITDVVQDILAVEKQEA